MGWNLDKKRPLCPQICEQICVLISKGELKPGERLMSVREVAVSASVNPNTVQKSFEQLEQRGVIYSKRGSGWYVAESGAEFVTDGPLQYVGGVVSDGGAEHVAESLI